MTRQRPFSGEAAHGSSSRFLAAGRLYWLLLSAGVRAKMQYKFNFISSTLIQVAGGLYDFSLIAVLLWRFKSIHGWNIYEVGVLYGVSRVGYGLYRIFGNELERFESYIVRGDFDSMLVRPWPSLFMLLSRNVELSQISLVIEGAGVGGVSAMSLVRTGALRWTDVGWLLYASLASACLYTAVAIATASAAFHIVRIEELQVFTQNAPSTAGLYPLDIYPAWLKYMLLTVIPLGLGNYIPVKFLLGKGGTWFNLAVPALACVLSLRVANRLWHLGESRYHSTGS